MFWIILFTLSRLKLNIKNLHLSRAYLTIPIISFNIISFLKSNKKLYQNDSSQLTSTKLMYSFFISDLFLFIYNRVSSKSIYFHHLFCTISYLISSFNGSPKIYTFVSVPELMACGILIKNKLYRDIFYCFIILFRLPFWYTILKESVNFKNNILVKYNSLIGGPIMFLLDFYWFLQIIYNYKNKLKFTLVNLLS